MSDFIPRKNIVVYLYKNGEIDVLFEILFEVKTPGERVGPLNLLQIKITRQTDFKRL